MGFGNYLKRIWKDTTIEPVILLMGLAFSVLSGAQVQTNLLMWKICHIGQKLVLISNSQTLRLSDFESWFFFNIQLVLSLPPRHSCAQPVYVPVLIWTLSGCIFHRSHRECLLWHCIVWKYKVWIRTHNLRVWELERKAQVFDHRNELWRTYLQKSDCFYWNSKRSSNSNQ